MFLACYDIEARDKLLPEESSDDIFRDSAAYFPEIIHGSMDIIELFFYI